MFYNGQWGTVCDDHWSEIDANIVCKELGFARAISSPGFATFGQGTGIVREGGREGGRERERERGK